MTSMVSGQARGSFGDVVPVLVGDAVAIGVAVTAALGDGDEVTTGPVVGSVVASSLHPAVAPSIAATAMAARCVRRWVMEVPSSRPGEEVSHGGPNRLGH